MNLVSFACRFDFGIAFQLPFVAERSQGRLDCQSALVELEADGDGIVVAVDEAVFVGDGRDEDGVAAGAALADGEVAPRLEVRRRFLQELLEGRKLIRF